jgi:RHS repeat-associated protein
MGRFLDHTNGNMNSRNGSSVTYTSYNLPSVINSASNSSAISYGAFRNRYKQVAVTSGVTETTIYVAGLLEKVTKSGVTQYRHKIHGGNGVAAIYTRRTSGSPLNSTYYVHTDHLGSPELITDSAGAQVVKLSFGAYGERRDSDWDGAVGSADQTTIGNTWRGGFTGHEHLDSVGLIHMNGRVYDPVVARFLSRDPFIDGVDSSQGPNGYAYVHNNPLNRIDPSGFVNYCAVDIPCRTINPDDPFYEFGMDQFERDCVSERSAQNRPRDDSISLENLPPPSFVSFANYVQRPLAVFTGSLMGSAAGSTVGGTCPGSCHTSGIAIPEVTPEVRAATTRFYQNLGEDFIPVFGPYRLATGKYYFSGDDASRLGGALASAPYFGIVLRSGARLIPWSSRAVRGAAESLEMGATEVRVGSRSEAAELFLGRYQGAGYRNSTGMSPREAKDFFGGKAGTYHWDIGDAAFPHGASHLQIHTLEGQVIRIYFPD